MNEETEQEIQTGGETLSISIGRAIGANTDFLSAQSFSVQLGSLNFLYIIAGEAEDAFGQIRKVGLDLRDNLSLEKELSQTIRDSIEFVKNELAQIEGLQITFAVIRHETLYFSIHSKGHLFLQRRERIIEIGKSIEPGKIISGAIHPGDKVLLINDHFSKTDEVIAWENELIQGLFDAPIDQLEEEIEVYLQRFSLSSPIAVAGFLLPAREEEAESSTQPREAPRAEITKPIDYHQPFKIKRKLPIPNLLRILRFSTRRKRFIMVMIITGVLLFGFIGVNAFRTNSQKNSQIQNLITTSKGELAQAMAKKDTDQEGARGSLSKARQSLDQALKIDPKNNEVLELQKQINDQSGAILKEYQITNFPIFMDLSLIKEGFSVQNMSNSLTQIAFLDLKQKSLVSLDLTDKNPKILAGEFQLGNPQAASINGNQVFVYSRDKGIVSIDIGNSKATVVVQPDSEWQRVVDIYGFANNVYLLDEFKNQIWKYIATESGFSERNNYLTDDTKADFAAARRMHIDGAVWVLRSKNIVLKFIQGGGDFFSFQGVEPEIANIKNFFVSDETSNAYFLDNDNGRVVVTEKNGKFVSQYMGEKFKSADDLIIDEKVKRMYLLEAGKIYQIELQ